MPAQEDSLPMFERFPVLFDFFCPKVGDLGLALQVRHVTVWQALISLARQSVAALSVKTLLFNRLRLFLCFQRFVSVVPSQLRDSSLHCGLAPRSSIVMQTQFTTWRHCILLLCPGTTPDTGFRPPSYHHSQPADSAYHFRF